MNKRTLWTRRILMTIIFFAALFSTYQGISGVEASSLKKTDWQEVKGSSAKETSKNLTRKQVGVSLKYLNTVSAEETQISSSEEVTGAPPKLEDAFDWDKYPKATVVATGYTAGYESTGKNPSHPDFGITYSGVKVTRDLFSTVAADLRVFPIGTILFIPDYGYGVVADKGGAIKGNKLDLYYETVDDVYNKWGKRTLEVYVIEEGDGKLTEEDLRALNEDKTLQVFRQQFIGAESR